MLSNGLDPTVFTMMLMVVITLLVALANTAPLLDSNSHQPDTLMLDLMTKTIWLLLANWVLSQLPLKPTDPPGNSTAVVSLTTPLAVLLWTTVSLLLVATLPLDITLLETLGAVPGVNLVTLDLL